MQDTLCIPVSQVGMWLCTINASRVSEDVRPKLLAFQEHLQIVVHDYLTGRLTSERLQKLEALVMTLVGELEALKQENLTLKEKLCASNALDRALVSNAGRQLAA